MQLMPLINTSSSKPQYRLKYYLILQQTLHIMMQFTVILSMGSVLTKLSPTGLDANNQLVEQKLLTDGLLILKLTI